MGYLLKKIKEQTLTVFAVLCITVSVSGCGMENTADAKPSATNSTKTDVTSYKAENKDSTDTTDDKENNSKDTDETGKVPIYGKNQKAKIKKYLASLPDTMTVKEARKRGIVIINYNAKKKNPFKKDWMDFYKDVRIGEKQHSLKNGVICYEVPYDKRAITILGYTVEGDACYTYLSFVDGTYYVLNDSSRDKFRDSSCDVYSDLMTYKSLRKYKNDMLYYNVKKDMYDKNKLSPENIQFYLFKKQGITSKKVKKIVGNPDYKYGDDYYNIFELDILR